MQARHIKSLDAIRGIAAINVLLYHLYLLNHNEETIYTFSKIWGAGHEAVILFFVLSGFVLSLKGQTISSPLKLVSYAVKRVCRIFPAYYATMIAMIIFFIAIKPIPLANMGSWFNSQLPSLNKIDKHVILTIIFLGPSNKLNGVVWSLSYELLISVFYLPLFNHLARKYQNTGYVVLIIATVYFIIIPPLHFVQASIYYAVFFMLGSYLAKYHTCYQRPINGHTQKHIYNYPDHYSIQHHIYNISVSGLYLLPLYLLLYFNKFLFFGLAAYSGVIRDLLTGFGAFGLIYFAINNLFLAKILNCRVLQFYGKTSYSFYLWHIPVIYLTIYVIPHTNLPLFWVKIVIFIITSIIAWLSYILIEKPGIRLGLTLLKAC